MPSSKFIILTALVCIVLAMLTAAVTGGREQKARTRPQTIETLQTSSREKALDWKRYENYAQTASREGNVQAEHLFRSISLSDSINMAIQQLALKRLGSSVTIVFPENQESGSTEQNLHKALLNRRQEASETYPAYIGQAKAEDARYTMRILIWAEGTAAKQAGMLDRLINCADHEHEETLYWVCPTCGNTFSDPDKESYCPYCMTPQEDYIDIGNLTWVRGI